MITQLQAENRQLFEQQQKLLAGYQDGLNVRRRLREIDRSPTMRDQGLVELGDISAHFGSAIMDSSWVDDTLMSQDRVWFKERYGVDIEEVKTWQANRAFIDVANWHFNMVHIAKYGSGTAVSSLFISCLSNTSAKNS